MLDEVDQRRADMRVLREADDAAAVRLAAAAREAEDAAADEEDARTRWADATREYPALADPAQLARARLTLSEAVADAVTRAGETRSRLAQLRTRLRSAEDAHGAESEVYGMARAHMDEADNEVQEAQRILNQARNALQAAGLENVEVRITQLQRRLKSAEERARQTGVAKGIALHQVASAKQARESKATEAEQHSRQLQIATQPSALCLQPSPIASICLNTRWTIRSGMPARSRRGARAASDWKTICRGPSAPPSASRRDFW